MATGIAQIRPIMLRDYNGRAGESLTLEDCYKKQIRKKIFMFYASGYRPDQNKEIAKFWNRSKTDRYWRKVKKQLEMK